MITVTPKNDFYLEFLMARGHFDPKDFGVELDRTSFQDQVTEEFGVFTHGQLSLDEILFRPSVALDFCQFVRRKYGWFDVPDDIILRSIMTLRKRSKGGKRKASASGR